MNYGFIKKFINNKCYIFTICTEQEIHYDYQQIFKYKIVNINDISNENMDPNNSINNYMINNIYYENIICLKTYEQALFHNFMIYEQWKYYENGYSGLYKHYNGPFLIYQFFHINGKINDSYIDNKIKYTYVDGNLIEKYVYYDIHHTKLKKYLFQNNENVLEAKIYDKTGICIEHYTETKYNMIANDNNIENIQYTKRKSKIFDKVNGALLCECSYLVCDDKFFGFIDNYKEYNITNIIECSFNGVLHGNGLLHGKFTKLINNIIIDKYEYENNIMTYHCEYYENENKKLEYIKLSEQNIYKYIEYFPDNSIKRIYYLNNNNKFINEYIEYHPNNILYKKCKFINISYQTNTIRIENLKIYDIYGNIIKKPTKINKSFIRYPNRQLYPFFKYKNKIPLLNIIKYNLYISHYLNDDNNRFSYISSYNILRVMSGLGGLAYST